MSSIDERTANEIKELTLALCDLNRTFIRIEALLREDVEYHKQTSMDIHEYIATTMHNQKETKY